MEGEDSEKIKQNIKEWGVGVGGGIGEYRNWDGLGCG